VQRMLVAIMLFASAAFAQAAPAVCPAGQTCGWKLVWSDEFNGPAGASPDSTKWNFDLGNNGGWGNHEAETYTQSTDNVFQDGQGHLVIRAIKDAQGNYTSARLQTGAPGATTHGADGNWQYGRIEARIKLPFGHGVWPAFWMLGENISQVSWPRCGEVDIMENFGVYENVDNTSVNNGTIHGPGPVPTSDYPPFGVGTSTTLPFGETVYDDFHTYAIEWTTDSIEFFFDGLSYQKLTPASLPAGSTWVFNAPFFILINLAIGGPSTFLGTPDASVTFPKDMLVDYVRVYQPAPITATTPVITPGRIVNAASFLGALAPGSLAALYGTSLADDVHVPATPGVGQTFPTALNGVSVTVNDVPAPLVFVSPHQINFQVPWETPTGTDGEQVPVKVIWNNVASEPEMVTVTPSSPSFFLSEYVNGVAWVTGNVADGCPTPVAECSVKANSTYELWANGLGAKDTPLADGGPAAGGYQVPGGPSSCTMTVGNQPAAVVYCGTAPVEVIDQVNFTYPSGVTPTASGYTTAALTVAGSTIHFRVPAPAQ